MSGKQGKKYGLIIKKKSATAGMVKKPSIFGDDNSSDEDEQGRQIVNKTIKKEAEKNRQIRQTQLEINKVLDQDPTAYEYDQVYDEMVETKTNLLAKKSADVVKKPKYIGNLLKFAETRKRQEERRVERQVQKERETEGEKFADKDAFVTTAYRKKMQELAEDEERQRKLDELEGDVTKQSDLSKFYRNLLDKNVSTGGAYNTDNKVSSEQITLEHEHPTTTQSNTGDCEGDQGTSGTSGGRLGGDSNDTGSLKSKTSHDTRKRPESTIDRRGRSEDHRHRKRSEDDRHRERSESNRKRSESNRERSESNRDRSESNRYREKSGSNRESSESDRVKSESSRARSKNDREGSEDSRSGRLSSKNDDKRRDILKSDGKLRDVSKDNDKLRDVPRDDDKQRDVPKDNDKPRDVPRDGDKPRDVLRDGETNEQDVKDDEQQERIGMDEKRSDIDEDVKPTRGKLKRSEQHEEDDEMTSKLSKHSTKETVLSAKERYLARKKNRVVVVHAGSDDEET